MMSIFARMSGRLDELLTSTIALGEVLVKTLAAGDTAWAGRYEKLLDTPGVSVLPFDRACARVYARLRPALRSNRRMRFNSRARRVRVGFIGEDRGGTTSRGD